MPPTAALTWFRALLEHERGAYWTFAIVTPGHVAVGASPEAHVSARDGVVTMNPISGTFRHPAGGATVETLDRVPRVDQGDRRALHGRGRRAQDDERGLLGRRAHHRPAPQGDVAPHAHRVRAARTQPARPARHPARDDVRADRDRLADAERVHGHHPPRDAPRAATTRVSPRCSLRAPTRSSRRVHARPRRADPDPHRVPRGRAAARARRRDARAPLRPVRRGQRDPRQGRRRARRDRRGPPRPGRSPAAVDATAIDEDAPAAERPPPRRRPRRSRRCSPRATPGSRRSGSTRRTPLAAGGPFPGRSAIVVDAEDRFTTMLAHQLRHLGLAVQIVPWSEITDEQIDARRAHRLGPRPRRPARSRPRRGCARMREVVARRRDVRAAAARGLPQPPDPRATRSASSSPRWTRPHQGLQKTVDVFGVPASIGFYNTFTARVAGRHDRRRRGRGRRRSAHGRRVRAARPGLRLDPGPPGVDPVARRHDDPRAARLAPRSRRSTPEPTGGDAAPADLSARCGPPADAARRRSR